MAAGDFTPKKLLQKALDTTTANSQITGAVNTRTIITSISAKLQNAGVTKRTVTVYLYGTAAANEQFVFVLDPAGVRADVITGLDWVLAAGETLSIAQDVGADVNIAVMGVEEALA